jgi:hypothetical protein
VSGMYTSGASNGLYFIVYDFMLLIEFGDYIMRERFLGVVAGKKKHWLPDTISKVLGMPYVILDSLCIVVINTE